MTERETEAVIPFEQCTCEHDNDESGIEREYHKIKKIRIKEKAKLR